MTQHASHSYGWAPFDILKNMKAHHHVGTVIFDQPITVKNGEKIEMDLTVTWDGTVKPDEDPWLPTADDMAKFPVPKSSFTLSKAFELKQSMEKLTSVMANTGVSAEVFTQEMHKLKAILEQEVTAGLIPPIGWDEDPPSLKDEANAKAELMKFLDAKEAQSLLNAMQQQEAEQVTKLKPLFSSQSTLSWAQINEALGKAEMTIKADGTFETTVSKPDPVFGERVARAEYERDCRSRENIQRQIDATERLVEAYRKSLRVVTDRIERYEITHDLVQPAPTQPTRMITLTDGE